MIILYFKITIKIDEPSDLNKMEFKFYYSILIHKNAEKNGNISEIIIK